jgi:hypothetical protein
MIASEQDIIYELHKLSSSILPEKADWSIEELYNLIFKNTEPKKPEELEKLNDVLKNLEQKQGVVLKDGFNSIDLIESKLAELIDSKTS